MAQGDVVEVLQSVSGGSSSTTSVPSGEQWVISSGPVDTPGGDNTFLKRTDGTNTGIGEVRANNNNPTAQRLVFDSHDLVLDNAGCSSQNIPASGREL